jgi:lipopolysaccharide/colanic/teichoic acid biosynthesis glycosyltransferase
MKILRFRAVTLIIDIVILAIAFLIAVSFKPSGLKGYLPSHSIFFAGLTLIWILFSILNGKIFRGKVVNYSSMTERVLSSNIISLAIIALLMYTIREYSYSRTVVLGTVLNATIIELIAGAAYIAYKKAHLQDYEYYADNQAATRKSEQELVEKVKLNGKKHEPEVVNPKVLLAIEKESGPDAARAIIRMCGGRLNGKTAVLSTTTVFNISSLPEEEYDYIINLKRINDIIKLNDFIDEVNHKLRDKGNFLCCVETKDQRKARILRKFPPVLNYIYYSFDFVLKRIMPKLRFTRGLYKMITHDLNKVYSRAEALGRLSRAGFMIDQESFIGDLLYIEVTRVAQPIAMNGINYGPLIALPRIGKGGGTIKVYKLRTMHPYSEYIQDYVYKQHDLKDGGKFRDDFRITSWGRLSRKIWLDELPMLINFFKGNMKLVGVRPLSRHYFELYSKDLQERRIKYKPGLIPPFYADIPSDLDAIQTSEHKYLDSYDKNPFLTDFRYFWKSLWNILFRNARSG